MQPIFFITGTDTGVGKTVLTALWTAFLRGRGVKVAAFKPICSGGRADALALHAALDDTLTLAQVNPWHFRAPLAPVLAARREKKTVKLAQVCAHIRTQSSGFELVLVEGAGGLLSPLGEDFDSRDLLLALRACVIIVAPNQLGVVNHVRLTLAALPEKLRDQAGVVLMSPAKPDAATAGNLKLLEEFVLPEKILTLPWLGKNHSTNQALQKPPVKRVLQKLSPFK
ncbi:MAG: dethiobiotin synthase [Verrucomicrobiae bacterium]|nr:dethiobiotin synthase [Verrucomicrobiae bacterium]